MKKFTRRRKQPNYSAQRSRQAIPKTQRPAGLSGGPIEKLLGGGLSNKSHNQLCCNDLRLLKTEYAPKVAPKSIVVHQHFIKIRNCIHLTGSNLPVAVICRNDHPTAENDCSGRLYELATEYSSAFAAAGGAVCVGRQLSGKPPFSLRWPRTAAFSSTPQPDPTYKRHSPSRQFCRRILNTIDVQPED